MGYEKEDNQLRFYVRDTGIGISPEKQAIIFDPFRQEEEDTSKHYGGTGLGLSVSYAIVKEHKGTIRVTSSAESGTAFTLRFPAVLETLTGENHE